VVGSDFARRLAQAFEGGSSAKESGCVWWLVRGWLPPSPILVKCRLQRHLANHLVNQGRYLVNQDPTVRPNYTTLRTRLLLWGVLCRQVRLSLPLGEEVGLILLPKTLGMAGVGGCWPWRWPWCWSWGLPPTST
jgi:hypothetical protein